MPPSAASTPPPSPPENRLPDLLVIGAMKSGTTTLYHDLRKQPGITLPDKESNALLEADPAAAFSSLFHRTKPGTLVGEVCPDYTKPGSGERAAAAAGVLFQNRPPPRLIYLVREPLARIRSHHHFISSQQGAANPGHMTGDLDASLRDFPELIGTSRYATRLRPWIESCGRENLKVIRFEDYIDHRNETLREIAAFLGIPGTSVQPVDRDRIHNRGDARPVATPGWQRLRQNPLYRKWVRPFLPIETRDRIRARILPKSPPRPSPPGKETLEKLREELMPEVEALSEIVQAPALLWDLEAAAAEILAEGQPSP